MTAFSLPDLGEGLKEAELIDWLVGEGQIVTLDEIILLVETAKAVVELPAPASGKITRLAAHKGETVAVGQVLFEYEENDGEMKIHSKINTDKSVSVVGKLSQSENKNVNNYEIETIPNEKPTNKNHSSTEKPVCINAFKEAKSRRKQVPKNQLDRLSKAPTNPEIMAFAKKLGIADYLIGSKIQDLSMHDLLDIFQQQQHRNNNTKNELKLKGSHKVMAELMSKSQRDVPAATIFEDADISSWKSASDTTIKLIRATESACRKVPILNAWFDTKEMTLHIHENINIGLAMQTNRGLFVPVIKQTEAKTDKTIRAEIIDFRNKIEEQKIKPDELSGATISISNFGALYGRYATPMIVPPQVCIIGVGKSREQALVKQGKIVAGRILPISLSFDHRAANGADAAKFLEVFIGELERL